MAAAKKCDICGTLYKPYNQGNNSKKVNGILFANIDTNGRFYKHNPIDCCPICMERIQTYINSLKVNSDGNQML